MSYDYHISDHRSTLATFRTINIETSKGEIVTVRDVKCDTSISSFIKEDECVSIGLQKKLYIQNCVEAVLSNNHIFKAGISKSMFYTVSIVAIITCFAVIMAHGVGGFFIGQVVIWGLLLTIWQWVHDKRFEAQAYFENEFKKLLISHEKH